MTVTLAWSILEIFPENQQPSKCRGLRVPGDAFQVSTIEAHDAMVKFGSMPQRLETAGRLGPETMISGLIATSREKDRYGWCFFGEYEWVKIVGGCWWWKNAFLLDNWSQFGTKCWLAHRLPRSTKRQTYRMWVQRASAWPFDTNLPAVCIYIHRPEFILYSTYIKYSIYYIYIHLLCIWCTQCNQNAGGSPEVDCHWFWGTSVNHDFNGVLPGFSSPPSTSQHL